MKCSKCGNDLRIESDSVEKGKYCSSCEKHDFPECNSIEEVLRWIVQNRGVNVFQNSGVINAILSDLAPKDEKGRIKIKNALAVGAGDYFYGIVQQGTLNEVSRKQFLSDLSSNGFTIEFCNFIYDTFAYSIHQKLVVAEQGASKTSANDTHKLITTNMQQNSKIISYNFKPNTQGNKGEEIVKEGKTWPDGTIYKGEFLDDMCHGKGVMISPSGDKFEGEFWKGKKIKGTYTFADGKVYKGGFLDGMFHGKCVVTWPDGTKFEGEFLDDMFHGKGVMTWPDGKVYKGEFLDGMLHGKGVMTRPDGTKFEGEFCKGKRKKGTLTYPDGTIYKGEFLDDMCHGKGVMTWPEGDEFEGEYCKDKKIKGTYTFADGKVYKGEFLDGMFHGKGVMTWPDGTKFEGEFCKGKRKKGPILLQMERFIKASFKKVCTIGKVL